MKKKGKHSTFNIQHSTLNDGNENPWAIYDGENIGRKFDLEERLLEFTSAVIDLTEKLPNTRAGNHVANQILRSGTSPYPNHGEAEAAESRDDFIHKLKICLKELRETRRWGKLIRKKAWTEADATLLFVLRECDELIRIFHSSIQTAKRNAQSEKQRKKLYPSNEAG